MQKINYKNILASVGVINVGEYDISTRRSDHISIKHCSVKGRETLSRGRKFHFSIEDSDANLELAWDNIVPVLIQNNVRLAKFTKPGL